MTSELNYCGLNDVYFKELLKNKKVVKYLLKGICDIDVDDDEIEYQNVEIIDQIRLKTTRFDVMLKVYNTRVDIETENSRHGDIEYYNNRKFYYLSRLHGSSYENIDYDNKVKSVVVFLYNFDIGYDELITETTMINKSTKEEYDNLRIYEINLSKVSRSSTIEIERLFDLLKSKDIASYLDDKNIFLKEVANMIKTYDEDEILRLQAELRRMNEIEIRSMKSYAKRETSQEIAKNMLNDGLDVSVISKYTGLSVEQINKLK